MQQVRTRIAPSPTGNLHIGTAYTTLFNYLYARKNQGKFILRIEDTDQSRSTKEFEINILDGVKWLNLSWDEGPIYQMKRLDSYKQVSDKLVSEGKAYYCFCTPEELEKEKKDQQTKGLPQVYSGKCRNLTSVEVEELKNKGISNVIRFKMPDSRGIITFDDLIHGPISIDSSLLGDMVIMRSTGIPLYNFAVVVDDIDMKITHVLRAEDHISNTPKQIAFFEAIGVEIPKFAHWPVVLNSDRIGKLSKRDGATSIDDYKKLGFLPEAIVNYFSLLGWTMPDDREIMSLSEMEQTFELTKMRKSPAAFDINKLEWLNGEYIRKMSDEELTQRLQDFLVDHPNKDKISPLVPLIKERIKKLSDFIPLTDFIFEDPEYDIEVFKKLGIEQKNISIKDLLTKITQMLETLPRPWSQTDFETKFREMAKEQDLSAGLVFQLIRVAISGQTVTPPLLESMNIIGEDKILDRIKILAEKYPNI